MTATHVANGHWKDFKNVERALAPIVAELGRMPTHTELRARRLGGLLKAIRLHGGPLSVATRIGAVTIVIQKPSGYWKNFSNVETELRAVYAELGRVPTRIELCQRGLSSLVQSIDKYHGGSRPVAQRIGLEGPACKPPGHWNDIANVEAVIKPIVQELGRIPRMAELNARRLGSLVNAISKRHGGIESVVRRLGLGTPIRRRPGHWKDFENVERTLLPLIAIHGRMPTHAEMMEQNLHTTIQAVSKYHGGFPAVAVRLGLGPVTDETITNHADALATIIPALGADPTILWARIKRSWTARDLDAAVETVATTGSLERFERLAED